MNNYAADAQEIGTIVPYIIIKQKESMIETIKNRYDDELKQLHQHNIHLHGEHALRP